MSTAWLLSADGYLLTAAHVLGKKQPSEQVTVQFVKMAPDVEQPPLAASVETWRYEPERGIDFADFLVPSSANCEACYPVLVWRGCALRAVAEDLAAYHRWVEWE